MVKRVWFWETFPCIFLTLINQTECQVVIMYNPWVRDKDDPYYLNPFTVTDMKVQLELVASEGFQYIATYSMGAPLLGEYKINTTWENGLSIIHTSQAAAEINKEKGFRALTVLNGIWTQDYSASRVHSEIELGFEVSAAANRIYEGTVTGFIFPSYESFDKLFPMIDLIKNVSTRAQSIGLKFGMRIFDCLEKIAKSDKDKETLKALIGLFDFIVCRMYVNINTFPKGPDTFKNIILTEFHQVENATKYQMDLATEVILETGWPSGTNLNGENTIKDMLHFWELMRTWANKEKRMLFLNEAFNSPWQDTNDKGILYAGSYGLWMHQEGKDNSRSSYVWKATLAQKVSRRAGKNEWMGIILIAVIVGLCLLLLVSLVITTVLVRQRVINRRGNKLLSEEEIREFLEGSTWLDTSESLDTEPDNYAWAKLAYNRMFELGKDNFSIGNEMLGKGEFGYVFKGHIEIDGAENCVAFKTTTVDSTIFALRSLLSEIKVLSYLGQHENVVSLCGAYTAELGQGIVYVATELCANGSLEKYLQENGVGISDFQLARWSFEIASGMAHISSKKIIHRDLATRNVLVTASLTAKVTDFGLSRRLYENMENVRQISPERLPWKWMAIESLTKLEFSVKSDVWSYGVTLYEIFSLGKEPYSGQFFDENFITRLKMGLRMNSPSRMPPKGKEIIVCCWHREPTVRPSFDEISITFSIIMESILSKNSEAKSLTDNNQLTTTHSSPKADKLPIGYVEVEIML